MTKKYGLYIGQNIKTVSLWRRDGETEVPIYANTRGQCEWYSSDTDTYENTDPVPLSDTMKEWLAHYYRVQNNLLEREGMFPQRRVEADEPDAEPEWYEIEVLNAIGSPSTTPEQTALMEWAYNEVSDE